MMREFVKNTWEMSSLEKASKRPSDRRALTKSSTARAN
jgi:hypothetical protein